MFRGFLDFIDILQQLCFAPVKKSVLSVVNQKCVRAVLLVEDGFTDKSFSVCLELAELFHKVKVFRHDDGRNLGAGAIRDVGAQHSISEVVAFLDADDIYLPSRFKQQGCRIQ